VDGQLRVRSLSGTDARVPVVLPDGTLGVSAPYNNVATNTAPASPVLLGSVTTGNSPQSVVVSGTTAYVVSFGSTLQSFQLPPRAVTVNADGSLGSVALPSGAGFIQNQTTQQASSNFNISGNGSIGGNSTVAGNSTVGGTLTAGTASVNGILTLNTGDQDKIFLTSQGAVGSKLGHALGWGLLSYAGPGSGSQGYHAWLLSGATSYQERMRLTAAGLGIGTSTPGVALDVVGNINASGQVRASGVVLTSDRRFKQNIRPLGSALSSVLALRGVRYEWNALGVAHGGTAGAGQVGLIAQEVERLYPELVSTDAQGYKAVNYAQLTPVLIEALKEQQAQIEALKQQAAATNTRAASAETKAATLETGAAADHASLLTLQAQMARLLGEGTRASAAPRK
jgi:hypothetical protein